MPSAMKNSISKRDQTSAARTSLDKWGYPSGMVWCPMKMSGMALMKCAELQRQLGCGSTKQLRTIARARPDQVPCSWPWLRRGRECPQRADDKEVRELRLALSPLKLVEKSRKNPRAYRCSGCGDQKAFGARLCRRCWRNSLAKRRADGAKRFKQR
jgi:hypothetical protein